MQETWVQFLGREDPLEKEMTTQSSNLARRILWTEEPGRLQPVGSQESDMTERLKRRERGECGVVEAELGGEVHSGVS